LRLIEPLQNLAKDLKVTKKQLGMIETQINLFKENPKAPRKWLEATKAQRNPAQALKSLQRQPDMIEAQVRHLVKECPKTLRK
jgi:hypothetical protein